MTLPIFVALCAAGLFFLVALLSGVLKYIQVMRSPIHQAAPYIDIAHRASLLYSFACGLLAVFLEYSPHPRWLQLVSLGGPLLFFALAVATYLRLGLANSTDNQFKTRDWTTTYAMYALIVVELGGFLVLFAGFLQGAWVSVS